MLQINHLKIYNIIENMENCEVGDKKWCNFITKYFKFMNKKCEGEWPFAKLWSLKTSCSWLDLNYFNPYSYQMYKDQVNESNRKDREYLVFASTFTVGTLSLLLRRGPRKITRNLLFTYLGLSAIICPENLNPIK